MKKSTILITAFLYLSLTSFSQVFKFRSTITDVETTKTVNSNNEICYHTFDFDNDRVIFEGIDSNGEKTKSVFTMKSGYKDGITYVIIIDHPLIKEMRFSLEVYNLGWVLADKTRLNFHNVTYIKE